MNGKRFLIVTASVGSGHEKAAAAISQGISDAYPDWHCGNGPRGRGSGFSAPP